MKRKKDRKCVTCGNPSWGIRCNACFRKKKLGHVCRATKRR